MARATRCCIHLENKPGELGRIAAKLAKAKVNINDVYASTGDGKSATLILGVDNLSKASRSCWR